VGQEPVRIAVAGLGFMGCAHLQALARIPSARVVAVMDRDEERLAGDLSKSGGNLGIPGLRMDFSGMRLYRDFAELVADDGVDALDLCVPTHLHAEWTIEALRRGRHVIVEKPMALRFEDAARMCEEAALAGRVLMVAHVLRFMPAYTQLSAVVRSGRLGRVRSALFRRRTAVPEWAEWEFDRSKNGGGVFDLLIHDVDMALHLFGRPEAVSAWGYEDLRGGVDQMTGQLHYREVESVTITGGWYHRGEYPFSMEYTVTGDEGVVEFSSAGRPPTVYWKDGRKEELPVAAGDPYQAELEYFVECCALGTKPEVCPPEESAMAARVALLLSEARGQTGRVEL
jgi:predicted dehydrogenase